MTSTEVMADRDRMCASLRNLANQYTIKTSNPQSNGYSNWDDADDLIAIQVQKYCMEDTRVTMKLMKNHAYGSIMPSCHIYQFTGPYTVDGESWYQIDLDYEASQWLRELGDPRVVEVKNISRCFDVPEDIYIMLKLKWA